MRIRAIAVLLCTAGAALLAACGADGAAGSPSPRTEGASTATASTASDESTAAASTVGTPAKAPADDVPPFPDDTAPQSAKPAGKWDLVLVDVRVAEHAGFDRIVLDFTGTGTPGWAVDYVDEAVLEGSGNVVSLSGDAALNISAAGTTWPAPGYYDGPRRLKHETGAVTEVYVAGTWEGYTQVLAGIDSEPAPFRVFTLAHPSRLVVDVVDVSAD